MCQNNIIRNTIITYIPTCYFEHLKKRLKFRLKNSLYAIYVSSDLAENRDGSIIVFKCLRIYLSKKCSLCSSEYTIEIP